VIDTTASSRKNRNKDRSKPEGNRLKNYYARFPGERIRRKKRTEWRP